MSSLLDRLRTEAEADLFGETVCAEAADRIEELEARLDAVEALYNKAPQYQKRYGPDDMRPPDHTVYVEFSRDELLLIIA